MPRSDSAIDAKALAERATALAAKVATLRNALAGVIVGQDRLIEDLVVGVLARGHVLLEGLPGLGKTKLAHTISKGLGLQFARIQFTPDLMPSDITGTRVVEQRDGNLAFRFEPGPLFAQFVLADEINRATPKTQSALLEAMQEGSVTVAERTHRLPQPFTVVATQNPIELEGTFPLPEAQLDRFLFKLTVPTPGSADLVRILTATTGSEEGEFATVMTPPEVAEVQSLARRVVCGEHLLRLVAELVAASNPKGETASKVTKEAVRFGASPRAAQAIVVGAKVRALLDARPVVELRDIEACALPALCHRVHLSFEAIATDRSVSDLLPEWMASAKRAIR